jgi:hypothetical protein
MTFASVQAYTFRAPVRCRESSAARKATHTRRSGRPSGGRRFEMCPCWVPSRDRCASPAPILVSTKEFYRFEQPRFHAAKVRNVSKVGRHLGLFFRRTQMSGRPINMGY